MAQLSISPEADVRAKARENGLLVLMGLALTLLIPTLVDCGSGSSSETGFPNPRPLPVKLTVNPSSIAVVAGSTTAFTVSPSPSQGVSLAWSVSPASGGTITNSGVYTASQTAGQCFVVATWIPSTPSAGSAITGSAAVTVLAPVALNTDLTQAGGAVQGSGTIQNSVIVGQLVPSVNSTDPSGNTQVRTGLSIPVPCTGSSPSCH
jgi:hypothetical protein